MMVVWAVRHNLCHTGDLCYLFLNFSSCASLSLNIFAKYFTMATSITHLIPPFCLSQWNVFFFFALLLMYEARRAWTKNIFPVACAKDVDSRLERSLLSAN